jgi:hypothetical protein
MCSVSAGYFGRVSLGAHNESLQGSVIDKLLGRGRPNLVFTLDTVRARVLKGRWPAPELSR